jgi:hypothetical protein
MRITTLPKRLALLERGESSGVIGKVVHLADSGPQASRLDQLPELGNILALHCRFALAECAEEHADDRSALEQRQVDRDARYLAGGETDHEVAALPGQAAQRRLGERPTDGVVHDVDTLAAGDFLDTLAQVLRRVIDHVIGAEAARKFALRITACRSDDGGAHDLAEFDSGHPNAACRAQHQQRLARCERRALSQRVIAREVRQADAARRLETE